MPKRRNYSAEFKREAVAVANQPGVTKAQIGRELDVNPDMITRWQRELSQNGSKAFIGIVDSKFSKYFCYQSGGDAAWCGLHALGLAPEAGSGAATFQPPMTVARPRQTT